MKKIIAATIVVLLVVILILPVRAGPPGQGPPPRPPGPTDETPRGHIAPAEVEAQATISEGFEEGSVPPAGWTLIQINPNETWEIATLGALDGRYYALVLYDPAELDQDEVLLSPCFKPDSGSVKLWSYGSLRWCHDTDDNCDLQVWFVNGSWGGGDDDFLGKTDDDWVGEGTWSYSSFDFSLYASGNPARIALRYLGNNGDDVGVDDIRIDYTGTSCGDEVFLPIILRNY